MKDSLSILADEGILIASTNAPNVSIDQFQAMIEDELISAEYEYLKSAVFIVCLMIFKPLTSFPEGNYFKGICL